MKTIVLAGSKGIGKGISDKLTEISDEIITTSSSELDTSNIEQVKKFVKEQKQTDVLVLNFYNDSHSPQECYIYLI